MINFFLDIFKIRIQITRYQMQWKTNKVLCNYEPVITKQRRVQKVCQSIHGAHDLQDRKRTPGKPSRNYAN